MKFPFLPTVLTGAMLTPLLFPSPVQAQALTPIANAATPTLTLDLTQPGAPVSPMLYGLMTEEINYSYDGGLYAELLRNRSFKDDATTPVNWSLIQPADGQNKMELDTSQPINEALTTCLKLTATGDGPTGIANEGFWGIPLKPQTTYRASFWAKSDGTSKGPLFVSLQSADGLTTYVQTAVPSLGTAWQKYSVSLLVPAGIQPTAKARFVILTKQAGTTYFNLVSLFPPTFKNRPNGLRPDLMQMLVDMKPKFLRFPGGNYLEGDTIDTRFPWKNTLGALESRPGHMGTWKYRSSDGMGLLEFLNWCEDMGAQPLLAVYGGYSLRGDHVEPGTALQPFVDEALDEIEYVMGDVTTKWGARRAGDGHPAPFALQYVEIGNEDGFDKSMTYDGRYSQISDAIHAKYPQLQIISTVGGRDGLGQRQKVTSRPLQIVDEHYYMRGAASQSDAHRYDGYPRTGPKVFVGEWATRDGAPTTNLNAALGDAAWMTGMERNADHVILSCYAPLFVNVSPGAMQWPSDLIGYDALSCYGSPSYYAQKMFSTNLGDQIVPIAEENTPQQMWQPPTPRGRETPPAKPIPSLYSVATRDSKTGAMFLKIVNSAPTPQSVQFLVKGAGTLAPDGQLITLSSAKPEDTNSITDPIKIVPATTQINGVSQNFTRTFAPYSVNVLQLQTR